jgi:hypothetical protein
MTDRSTGFSTTREQPEQFNLGLAQQDVEQELKYLESHCMLGYAPYIDYVLHYLVPYQFESHFKL